MSQHSNLKSTLWYSGLVIDGVPLFSSGGPAPSAQFSGFHDVMEQQGDCQVGRDMKLFSTEFTVLSDYTDKGRIPMFII